MIVIIVTLFVALTVVFGQQTGRDERFSLQVVIAVAADLS